MRRWMVVAVLGVATVACGREPTREWTAADHDQPDNAPPGPAVQRGNPAEVQAQIAAVTWTRQCASCHGAEGRGNGPNGPMVGASDLTRPDWQARVDDAAIARAITEGKGKMPRFDLPPATVASLVKYVRQLRRP